jgi:hypothetical protein
MGPSLVSAYQFLYILSAYTAEAGDLDEPDSAKPALRVSYIGPPGLNRMDTAPAYVDWRASSKTPAIMSTVLTAIS